MIFFVNTYTADQWYEQYWSSIQLNLDEGTVLAFICRCSSLSSLHNHFLERMSAGLNHRPIANMEGQRRPLGLCPFLYS